MNDLFFEWKKKKSIYVTYVKLKKTVLLASAVQFRMVQNGIMSSVPSYRSDLTWS